MDGFAAWGRALVPALVARTDPADAFDPIAVYAAGVESGLEAALWLRGSEDLALVGLGRAWSVEAEGDGRFGGEGQRRNCEHRTPGHRLESRVNEGDDADDAGQQNAMACLLYTSDAADE